MERSFVEVGQCKLMPPPRSRTALVSWRGLRSTGNPRPTHTSSRPAATHTHHDIVKFDCLASAWRARTTARAWVFGPLLSTVSS